MSERIFSILPDDQSNRLIKLWQEYEKADTHEAKFAIALDRLKPLLHNFGTSGKSWRENGITKKQVLERNEKIDNSSHTLWEYAKQNILKAVENGILKDDAEPGFSHSPEGAGFF
jgi:putative hydrolase of HD superfamily